MYQTFATLGFSVSTREGQSVHEILKEKLVVSSGLILVNAHASYYSAEPQWRGTTNNMLPTNHDHTAKQLLTL
jgi:hypothetical protein